MKKISIALLCISFAFSACQKDALMDSGSNANSAISGGNETAGSLSGTTYFGNNMIMGKGHIRTYVTVDKTGKPLDVGVEFTEAAINTIDMPMNHSGMHCNTYNLRFHPNATKSLPYDHVSLDWAQTGHGPEGVYDVPHFDIHFYMVSPETQMSIITDRSYPVGPDAFAHRGPSTVPYSYFPGPFVEMMGTHWIKKEDFSQIMFNREPFRHTFIYGTHEDKLVFIEPMITLETLRTRENIITEIDQPQNFPVINKFYPGNYAITHNAKTRVHRVSLQNFMLQ
jgi:hypothetical protein